MASTDLEVRPEHLARIRKLYPGAIGVGRVTGLKHRRGEIRRREKRGEIIAVDRFAREVRPGVIEVPYIRLKTHQRVRQEQAVRAGGLLLGGLGVAYGVGWLIWESRMAILAMAAACLAGLGLLYLSLHWRNGCSGIHCAGCRG